MPIAVEIADAGVGGGLRNGLQGHDCKRAQVARIERFRGGLDAGLRPSVRMKHESCSGVHSEQKHAVQEIAPHVVRQNCTRLLNVVDTTNLYQGHATRPSSITAIAMPLARVSTMAARTRASIAPASGRQASDTPLVSSSTRYRAGRVIGVSVQRITPSERGVHDRPTLVGITFEPWRPGLPIRQGSVFVTNGHLDLRQTLGVQCL